MRKIELMNIKQTMQRKKDGKPCIAHMIGNISEISVAIDLIAREFYVYNAFIGTTPFDFVAMKDNKFYRIEVKTAHRNKNYKPTHWKINRQNYDILALYFPEENKVEYFPPFD